MKKYLLGLFAIAIAIAFSAFTNIKTDQKSDNLVQKHWYLFDASSGNLTEEIGFLEREDAVTASECPDAGVTDCAKAYDSQISGPFPVADPGGQVDQIRKN